MVGLPQILRSNAAIATSLPAELVAVFVGATNGIGEASMKAFAKHVPRPRIYFIGRSEEAGNRIAKECHSLNSNGKYSFIQADTSLIRNVDKICDQIKASEKTINLLFLSTGTLVPGIKTSEGLHLVTSLLIHSRTRFICNLLSQLEGATALRRVVTVGAGGKEGAIEENDLEGWKCDNPLKMRGHAASLVGLTLGSVAERAQTVSFVHDYPGFVKSGIWRGTTGLRWFIVRAVTNVIGPLLYIPTEESGERHLFLSTSAAFPAAVDTAKSVPLPDGMAIAMGDEGVRGSGVYAVDEACESAGPESQQYLKKYRSEGMDKKYWSHLQDAYNRITSS